MKIIIMKEINHKYSVMLKAKRVKKSDWMMLSVLQLIILYIHFNQDERG